MQSLEPLSSDMEWSTHNLERTFRRDLRDLLNAWPDGGQLAHVIEICLSSTLAQYLT